MNKTRLLANLVSFTFAALSTHAADGPLVVKPVTPADLFPLAAVRLLSSPFADAVGANRKYLLEHDPDRLRHPVRLVFEFGEMAMHQFAQPDIDWRN